MPLFPALKRRAGVTSPPLGAWGAIAIGHWRPNAERRSPYAVRRTPNADRRTPNADRRTPNAVRRSPYAERRTPNAERRTPVGQWMILAPGFPSSENANLCADPTPECRTPRWGERAVELCVR
jgi:hypothetical protein